MAPKDLLLGTVHHQGLCAKMTKVAMVYHQDHDIKVTGTMEANEFPTMNVLCASMLAALWRILFLQPRCTLGATVPQGLEKPGLLHIVENTTTSSLGVSQATNSFLF